MKQLRQRMQEDLWVLNFSERTARHHTHTVAEFATFFHKSREQPGAAHIRTFLLYLLTERKLGNDPIIAAERLSSAGCRRLSVLPIEGAGIASGGNSRRHNRLLWPHGNN